MSSVPSSSASESSASSVRSVETSTSAGVNVMTANTSLTSLVGTAPSSSSSSSSSYPHGKMDLLASNATLAQATTPVTAGGRALNAKSSTSKSYQSQLLVAPAFLTCAGAILFRGIPDLPPVPSSNATLAASISRTPPPSYFQSSAELAANAAGRHPYQQQPSPSTSAHPPHHPNTNASPNTTGNTTGWSTPYLPPSLQSSSPSSSPSPNVLHLVADKLTLGDDVDHLHSSSPSPVSTAAAAAAVGNSTLLENAPLINDPAAASTSSHMKHAIVAAAGECPVTRPEIPSTTTSASTIAPLLNDSTQTPSIVSESTSASSAAADDLEVCLIYHERKNEYILAKGRKDQFEMNLLETALRETHEETGYECVPYSVGMITRAPVRGADVKDSPEGLPLLNAIEPFALTIRTITPAADIKLIYWFIARATSPTLPPDASARMPSESAFRSVWVKAGEAERWLTHEHDRNVVRKAVGLVSEEVARRAQWAAEGEGQEV